MIDNPHKQNVMTCIPPHTNYSVMTGIHHRQTTVSWQAFTIDKLQCHGRHSP